jgi:transposase
MPKYGASRRIFEVKSNEVKPRAKRRIFSAQDKLRIINEIDNCSHGEIGKILRREGLYSGSVSEWRRKLNLKGISGFQNAKPGPRPKDKRDFEIAELRKRNAVLERELNINRALLDIQKKAFELLDLNPSSSESIS